MSHSTKWILGAVAILVLGIGLAFALQVKAPENRDGLEADVADAPEHELIAVFTPRAGDAVKSPLTIMGEARGTWFFEATFPVVVVDWDGRIIGEGYATAQDNWMTEDFVPFEATLTFETPNLYNRGAIILQKSNPSGLPEYDDALEIPVTFK